MALEYEIDFERKLVIVRMSETVSDAEIFRFQKEVWSRPEVAGFDELVDMTEVRDIARPAPGRVDDLARLAASMDPPGAHPKFAIVAPGDLAYGFGRMYATYRNLDARSRKEVGVFRSIGEAREFLGLASPDEGA